MALIQPQIPADQIGLLCLGTGVQEAKHATAALPDFHRCSDGWEWNRRPGVHFRIPQYDDYMCPDIDLPVAPDGVVVEPMVPTPHSAPTLPPISMLGIGRRRASKEISIVTTAPIPDPTGTKGLCSKLTVSLPKLESPRNITPTKLPPVKEEEPVLKKKFRLSHRQLGGMGALSPQSVEISLDELKKRLSQLIGVSLGELEKLFESSKCS